MGVAHQPLALNLDRAKYETVMKQGLTVTKTIELAKDAAELRVVVLDRYSGKIGSLNVPAAWSQ